MIRLEIEGQYVEMSQELEYSLNKAYEDLTNPTTIINEWSKTIEVPFTEHNNKIFGQFYNPNRIIVSGGSGRLSGLYFDPTKKLAFRLLYNEAVVMEGYLKTISVRQKDGRGTYIYVTLNGMLGKIFQEMKKISFDDTILDDPETQQYYIDGSEYVDEYITKDLVYDSFNTTGQSTMSLEDSSVHDIIGFAPNNAMSEDFDYKSYEFDNASGKGIKTFVETLNETPAYTDTNISADSLIPDGLLPREIGEYRSYNQLPYIYFNKLFQIFQKKSEELTGYDFELDSDWFNVNNPYWKDLVMMLNRLEVKDGNSTNGQNTYAEYLNFNIWGSSSHYTTPIYSDLFIREEGTTEEIPLVIDYSPNKAKFDLTKGTVNFSINNFDFRLRSAAVYYGGERKTVSIPGYNALKMRISSYDSENRNVDSKFWIICNENYTQLYANLGAVGIIGVGNAQQSGANYDVINFTIPKFDVLLAGKESAYITFSAEWVNDTKPIVPIDGTTVYPTSITIDGESLSMNTNIELNYGIKRSYSKITLNDLWNNEHNPFDTILTYCKVFGILIQTDDKRKKLKFLKRENFFSDYSILNWDDKLDTRNDFTISPIVFEDKYLVFNYSDYETKNNERYKQDYGVNYGEKRINTNYNFNTEEKDLFETPISPSVTCTDNILSWSNIYSGKIQYSFGSEIMIDNKNKERKEVNNFGAWFFRNGCASFDTTQSLNLRDVYITDDTTLQMVNSTFTYTQIDDAVYRKKTTKYPILDIVKGNKLCVFNKPMKNYTYLNNYGNATDIYTQRWENYLKEQYDLQRKKLTAYFKLGILDYVNFKFNQFVQLGNQIYLVLKIYDFKPNSTNSTKVDLLNIGSISNYTS